MRLTNKIVLASTNRHKFEEFTEIFRAYPEVELIPAEQILRNPEKIGTVEIHDTYLENATAKARATNQACHYPSLADDTGLEVDALGGRPGIHSQRYAKLYGKGQALSNNELLLKELTERPNVPRTARFIATLALSQEGLLIHATGVLEGTILEKPQGTSGFGYDPIFLPNGYQKTLAELTTTEKNKISHRAKAVHNLMNLIKAQGIVLAKP